MGMGIVKRLTAALFLSLALWAGPGALLAATGCNYAVSVFDSWANKATNDFLTVADVNQRTACIEALEKGPHWLNLGAVGAPAYAFTGDGDTGIYSSAANVLDIAAGGIRVASFGTVASGVNYIQLLPSATTGDVKISALGTDTDISLDLISKGVGTVKINGATITDNGAEIVRKTATETINTSTTLQNDDDLLFAVAANETVHFQFHVAYNSGTTPDIKFAVTVPSGATLRWTGFGRHVSTADGFTAIGSTASGTAQPFGGAGSDTGIIIRGTVINGGTPGNVTLQWAQNTSDAGSTSVLINSHLLVWRV